MRALGWRLDSDPWSWRLGSRADVDELGAERYKGRTMAGREAWWRLRRSAASLGSAAATTVEMRCRIRDMVEMR